MLTQFLIPFVSIALAEMGDKTQLALVLLGARTKNRFLLFWGAMAAFAVVDGVAIIAGSWVTRVVPVAAVQLTAAVLFVVMGILMLRSTEEHEEVREPGDQRPFWTSFGLIFLAEWADKTQIASGLFATRYAPEMVLAGTLAALAMLSSLGIFLGGMLASRLHPETLKRSAGIIFILLGAAFLIF